MRGGDVLKTGNVRKSEKRDLLTPPIPEKDLIGDSSILKNVNGLSDRFIAPAGTVVTIPVRHVTPCYTVQ
jgi:hypothetical protein